VSSRLWWWKKGALHGSLRRNDRPQVFQALARGGFWFVLGFATLAVFPRSGDMSSLIATVAGAWVVVLGLQLLQPVRTNRGPSVAMLVGALVLGFDVARALMPTVAPVVRLAPPFEGEWIVLQGGRSPLESHHLTAYNQEYALDLVKLEDDKIFKDGEGNENTWSWEAPLRSPVDGTVVLAKNDMEDSEGLNLVSEAADAVGNSVVIRTAEGHYALLAHLRRGSVVVSEGQAVKTGDPVGKTGNSGNTSMPHLHFQVQSHEDVWHPENRSLPFAFGDGAVLRRNDRVFGESR
jgi:hypothetical protein